MVGQIGRHGPLDRATLAAMTVSNLFSGLLGFCLYASCVCVNAPLSVCVYCVYPVCVCCSRFAASNWDLGFKLPVTTQKAIILLR